MRCTRCPGGVIMRIAAPMPGTIRSRPWWGDANASSVVHVHDVVRRHRHDPGRKDAWTRDSAWFSGVQAAGCSSCVPHTSLGWGEPEAYVRKGGMTPQAGTLLLGPCLQPTRDMQGLSILQVAPARTIGPSGPPTCICLNMIVGVPLLPLRSSAPPCSHSTLSSL